MLDLFSSIRYTKVPFKAINSPINIASLRIFSIIKSTNLLFTLIIDRSIIDLDSIDYIGPLTSSL